MDDVAGIDEAEAGAAAHRRADARVVELRLGIVDHALVALDLGRELLDGRLLGVELLLGRVVVLGEFGVALEIELGIAQVGLVLRLLGNRLVVHRLVGPRIDLGQQVALLEHLALLEVDLEDLAVDAAADLDGVEGLNGAQPVQIDREVALLHLCDRHRH